ncbi:DNA repair protein RadA [Chloroflexota bacterium]
MARADKSRQKTVFVCQQCGREELKWLGRCPSCQEWNTLIEQAVTVQAVSRRVITKDNQPQELSRVVIETADRFPLPMTEFNRVLGGGLVPGSLTLTGGDPGIGKSTLLLQVSALVAQSHGRVVYVSGEETLHQIKLRARRLGINGENLFLLAETDLGVILSQIEELSPSLVIIDSIQAVYLPELDSAPGSISQVRECTMRLMQWAKSGAVPVFIVGHVTKDGAIAGPRTLEHIVDAVLYLEGEPFSSYRLLRCVKNRFGSTNEIGIFEMKEQGLIGVDNPSRAFLSQRWGEAVGSTVVPVLEGSRPLLVEIQALTNPTSFGLPRRTANGIDFNRLLLITAVLTRRIGLKLGNQDIMVNAAGGLKIGEPAADLGIALAIVSSSRDVAVDPELAVIGEVGLSGELRAVSQPDRRVNEAARMGFKRCLVPKTGAKVSPMPEDIQVISAGTLKEAIGVGLVTKEKSSQEDS